MSRQSVWTKIVVAVSASTLLASACVSDKQPNFYWADRKPAPEGVDYLMAMQCAGLSAALGDLHSVDWQRNEAVRLKLAYSNWAMDRAKPDVRWATVRDDIAQSRDDFVAEAKESGEANRGGYLMKQYQSSFNVCRSLADLPDYIVIGG